MKREVALGLCAWSSSFGASVACSANEKGGRKSGGGRIQESIQYRISRKRSAVTTRLVGMYGKADVPDKIR
jgi:hypothetical protein